jgi:hypothetical protein
MIEIKGDVEMQNIQLVPAGEVKDLGGGKYEFTFMPPEPAEHIVIGFKNESSPGLKKWWSQQAEADMKNVMIDSLPPEPPTLAEYSEADVALAWDVLKMMNDWQEEIFQNTMLPEGVTVKEKKTLDRYGVQLTGA